MPPTLCVTVVGWRGSVVPAVRLVPLEGDWVTREAADTPPGTSANVLPLDTIGLARDTVTLLKPVALVLGEDILVMVAARNDYKWL